MSSLSTHSFHIPRKPVLPPRPLTIQTPGNITISQPPSRASTPNPPQPALLPKATVVTSPVIPLQTKEKAFNEHGFTATRIDRLCNAMQPLITRHATDAEFEELMREAGSYLQEDKKLKKRNQGGNNHGGYGGRRGSAVSATGSFGAAHHGHSARKGSVVSASGSITSTKGGKDAKKKSAWVTKLKIVVGLGGEKRGRRRGSC